MLRRFIARFRDEIDSTDLVAAVVLLGVLFVVGLESAAVAVLLGIAVGVPLIRAAVDATGLEIGSTFATVILGSIVVMSGVYGLLAGDQWLGSAFGIVGAWFVLDGIDAWRHGGSDNAVVEDNTAAKEDMSNEEVFLVGEHNRWLVEELREVNRPLTAAEIQSRTGLTESDFDRLLDLHGESGPIERVGNGYTIDETEMGGVAMVRSVVRIVGGRICRPLRLFRPTG